jgi:hypothetical protein
MEICHELVTYYKHQLPISANEVLKENMEPFPEQPRT